MATTVDPYFSILHFIMHVFVTRKNSRVQDDLHMTINTIMFSSNASLIWETFCSTSPRCVSKSKSSLESSFGALYLLLVQNYKVFFDRSYKVKASSLNHGHDMQLIVRNAEVWRQMQQNIPLTMRKQRREFFFLSLSLPLSERSFKAAPVWRGGG